MVIITAKLAAMATQRKPRMSRQRRMILDELRANRTHPTADEVYRLVRRRLPHISLGTVYRNLEALAAAGEIRKLRLGCAQSRFDGDAGRHYHVRCTGCGRVDDVAMKPLRAIEDALSKVAGYRGLDYRLEFMGLCERCNESGARCTGRRRRSGHRKEP
jgi:Fe2+ or Zn2+ uptake regulation protein